MKGAAFDDVIASRGPGFSIRANDQQFAIKAPLGMTRFDWAGVDGGFTEWSDTTVRFHLKPEYLARRSFWFRLAVRATRAMEDFNGISVNASSYGMTAEALTTALNERLIAQVGPVAVGADPETGLRVRKAKAGPFRGYARLVTWIVVALLSAWLLIRVAH